MKCVVFGLLLSFNVLIYAMEDKANGLIQQSNNTLSFSEEDYQIFCIAHAIADRIINIYAQHNINCLKDSLARSLDTSSQAKQGLFISDSRMDAPPSRIITPWGIWKFREPKFLGNYDVFESLEQQYKQEKITLQSQQFISTVEQLVSFISYNYRAVLAFNDVTLPESTCRKPEELIPEADALKLWVMMQNTKQRRDFEHATLKSLCIAYIKKNLQQFEKQLNRLPDDLVEVIK